MVLCTASLKAVDTLVGVGTHSCQTKDAQRPAGPSNLPQHSHRRALLLGSVTAATAALTGALPLRVHAALPAQVGNYLPPAGVSRPFMGNPQWIHTPTCLHETGVEDFVLFSPDPRKTPALRAGTVDPNDPYQFAMPPTWREGKVANIQSGSYCQVC